MEKYPDATFKFREFERDGKVYDVMYYADTSASVHCTVTINGVERDMWLPVMDFRNQSIPNPSSKDINDTKLFNLKFFIGIRKIKNILIAANK